MNTLKEAYSLFPGKGKNIGRKYLREFTSEMDIRDCEEVTLQHVLKYIEILKGRGASFDTRRLKILPIKQAMKMHCSLNNTYNPLFGFVLDRREPKPKLRPYTMDFLFQCLRQCSKEMKRLGSRDTEKGHRRRAVKGAYIIGLMGFAGLRQSEVRNLLVSDFKERDGRGVVTIGSNGCKNIYSMRSVPLPKILNPWMYLLEERDGNSYLMESTHGNKMCDQNVLQTTSTIFKKCLKPGQPVLPPKYLRKSFAVLRRTPDASGAVCS